MVDNSIGDLYWDEGIIVTTVEYCGSFCGEIKFLGTYSDNWSKQTFQMSFTQ